MTDENKKENIKAELERGWEDFIAFRKEAEELSNKIKAYLEEKKFI